LVTGALWHAQEWDVVKLVQENIHEMEQQGVDGSAGCERKA